MATTEKKFYGLPTKNLKNLAFSGCSVCDVASSETQVTCDQACLFGFFFLKEGGKREKGKKNALLPHV